MDALLNKLISFAKGLTLLYIEDDESSRNQTLNILQMFFSTIHVAANGAEGLDKYSTHKIDFIITDINMPIMNGIKFIEKIRQYDVKTPIFIVSAHSDTSFFLESIKLGVDGYLLKPLESTQFLDQITKTLHNLYLQKQLDDYHENLEKKVYEQVEQLRQKDKILLQQTKLATMGEMMDIIAHQWKSPLNNIAMNTALVWEMYEVYGNEIKPEDIKICYEKVKRQINHLTTTLGDFRNFFRPSERIKKIKILDILNSVLLLMHDELIKNNIKINIICNENLYLNINPNEIKHILINLISNSRDAFKNKEIASKQIDIEAHNIDENIFIKVTDNAGGIPEDIINDIFKPNFTTKSSSGGTGIGLYMSKFIAEKNNATIEAQNINGGAVFILKF